MTDKPPRESWESLTGTTAQPVAVPTNDTDDEMVMRALNSGDGKRLMDWLRAQTIEKRSRPGASEAELRETEAQRHLVARLEQMRDRGIEIARARSKPRS